MTYDEAKAIRDCLETTVRATSDALNSIPGVGTGAFGLTPDSVKMTAEWRLARNAFGDAVSRLKAFNVVFVKQYAKEIRAERRARFA